MPYLIGLSLSDSPLFFVGVEEKTGEREIWNEIQVEKEKNPIPKLFSLNLKFVLIYQSAINWK